MSDDDVESRVNNLEKTIAELKKTIESFKQGGRGPQAEVNMMNYMYRDAKIHQDIFAALAENVIQKYGEPKGWDQTSYATTKWNGRNILKIGQGAQANGNGLVVNIPPRKNNEGDWDVLWIRVLNDRYVTFRVAGFQSSVNDDDDEDQTDYREIYSCGLRSLIETSPDGAALDSQQRLHVWCPIPIRYKKKLIVYPETDSDAWISGIAFGKNIWGHAKNSVRAYHLNLNGETSEVGWIGDNWNSDVCGYIPIGKVGTLKVPVVPNGNDKILYLVEHNNNWVGTMHGEVRVNGKSVERFRTSYSNPFATHINSKIYARYMATRIPAKFIKKGHRFVTVTIDMRNSDMHLHFREAGTHDYM